MDQSGQIISNTEFSVNLWFYMIHESKVTWIDRVSNLPLISFEWHLWNTVYGYKDVMLLLSPLITNNISCWLANEDIEVHNLNRLIFCSVPIPDSKAFLILSLFPMLFVCCLVVQFLMTLSSCMHHHVRLLFREHYHPY